MSAIGEQPLSITPTGHHQTLAVHDQILADWHDKANLRAQIIVLREALEVAQVEVKRLQMEAANRPAVDPESMPPTKTAKKSGP